MPRFFCNKICDNTAYIEGDDAKHIAKVLRMRVGEAITINDMQGFDYDCEVLEVGEVVSLTVLSKYQNQTEPSVNITLYQCLPKGDKLEFIIQKAVELGVRTIVPVQSKFCVAKADKSSFAKKQIRYNKIALEAAKQSGRGMIPEVLSILTYTEAIERAKHHHTIVFYEGGGERVSNLVDESTKDVCVFVGAEGGFDTDEIQAALDHQFKTATLGALILRCETASIAGISLILQSTHNM